MGRYADDAQWADITPIPQNDGGPNPLAAIAYSEEYSEAMSYLRAVMANNEHSERVLALTDDIISMNPAHYTIWLYRAKCLFALNKDLRKELEWTNETALAHLKNYQIWHHRHTIIEAIAKDMPKGSDELEALMADEAAFIDEMFTKDAKNYHVWSYRQWLVQRFGLWDSPREIAAVEALLEKDVRNNSAWNHRWFVVFGRPDAPKDKDKDKEILERELRYTEDKIRLAPQNQSPWSYLRGLLKQVDLPLSTVKGLANEFADLDKPDRVRSSHALDMVADIAKEEKRKDDAANAFDLLANKYDPIRSRYWMWKKESLATAAA